MYFPETLDLNSFIDEAKENAGEDVKKVAYVFPSHVSIDCPKV